MRGLFGVMAAVLLTAVSAHATTYLVRPDGTGDFQTIQAAIDAAGVGDVSSWLTAPSRGMATGTSTTMGRRSPSDL